MKISRPVSALAFFGIFASTVSCTPPAHPNLPVIIDVDTGRDDAWALYGAIKERHVEAVISSYGNVPLERAVQNSLDVIALDSAAMHVSPPPVWVGEREPLPPGSSPGLSEIARRATVNGNGLANLVPPHSPYHPANGAENWTEGIAKLLRAWAIG
jgi:inosine-uridine nucleoside N-ribohydrolase